VLLYGRAGRLTAKNGGCGPGQCHNDGHWVEVAFPQADGMCDCAAQCLAHPSATAFQVGQIEQAYLYCLSILLWNDLWVY
jgi:hypothetical protein